MIFMLEYQFARLQRAMAFQYKSEVGPWIQYLDILQSRQKQ